MKTVLHKAETRGHANHGWLNSHHSFSFSGYFNPQRMNFGLLRVLNDDTVSPSMGFGTHPHDNMEIVSIPLEGALEHKDSMGNGSVIRKNDVQIMSAGTGIQHSEKNHHRNRDVSFLQIWVLPKEKDIVPNYDQITFDPAERQSRWQTVVSPDEDGAVWINQDAWFSLGNLHTGDELAYQIAKPGNGVYVFVLTGQVSVMGQSLNQRDGFGIWETDSINIGASKDAEVLLIEVPMSA